jgi:hypothetical protein
LTQIEKLVENGALNAAIGGEMLQGGQAGGRRHALYLIVFLGDDAVQQSKRSAVPARSICAASAGIARRAAGTRQTAYRQLGDLLRSV